MARLTTIYTRTGDDGMTGLVGGTRVSKDSPRIEAIGTVDELNAVIGLARSLYSSPKLDALLAGIQNDLFNLGAELATPPEAFVTGMPHVRADRIAALEQLMDDFNRKLGPLKEFVLPSGPLHLARTVCRRAERVCVRLKTDTQTLTYLNRLGDVLFVLARWANRQQKRKETYWKK